MGVDQILGAKIVNARGETEIASEELLVGIRGGGGSLGVIIELTIKVYPVSKVRRLSSPQTLLICPDSLFYYSLRVR
jgi:FAD/FMN-containing dehydrogenase